MCTFFVHAHTHTLAYTQTHARAHKILPLSAPEFCTNVPLCVLSCVCVCVRACVCVCVCVQAKGVHLVDLDAYLNPQRLEAQDPTLVQRYWNDYLHLSVSV